MADNPDIQWALKTLEPYEETNFIYKNGSYLGAFVIGVLSSIGANILKSRPISAGIHLHVGFGIFTAIAIGIPYETYLLRRAKKNYAIARDYIIKHPDDFPEPAPMKWGDVFDKWYPLR